MLISSSKKEIKILPLSLFFNKINYKLKILLMNNYKQL